MIRDYSERKVLTPRQKAKELICSHLSDVLEWHLSVFDTKNMTKKEIEKVDKYVIALYEKIIEENS